MQRYGGKLIHLSRDSEGPIEIVEEGSLRALHFGSSARQSCVDMARPQRLVLSYSEAMMASLLFQPAPQRILMVGLGAGALAHFLLHHLPLCRVEAVEMRLPVIRLARSWFALPDTARLNIHHGDGGEFVRRAGGRYDLLLVDAYHAEGMAAAVDNRDFFSACHSRLNPGGVLSINLWSSQQRRLRQSLSELGNAFSGHLLQLPVKGRGNVVALGFTEAVRQARLKALRHKAAELGARFELPLGELLRDLRRHNGGLFRRLFG